MPLRLEGSVDVTVDGPAGTTVGTVRGDGSVLRVSADDAVVAWDALAGVTRVGPAALGVLADSLHGQGLAVEVSGPDGRLALVGAGADSVLGRAVTGSRRVQPGRPAALRPLVLAEVRRAARRPRTLLVAGAAVALLAVRRRRRPH